MLHHRHHHEQVRVVGRVTGGPERGERSLGTRPGGLVVQAIRILERHLIADEIGDLLLEQAHRSVAALAVIPLERQVEIVRGQRHERRVRAVRRRHEAVDRRALRAVDDDRRAQIVVLRARDRLAVREARFQVVPQVQVEIEARQRVVITRVVLDRREVRAERHREVVVVLPEEGGRRQHVRNRLHVGVLVAHADQQIPRQRGEMAFHAP